MFLALDIPSKESSKESSKPASKEASKETPPTSRHTCAIYDVEANITFPVFLNEADCTLEELVLALEGKHYEPKSILSVGLGLVNVPREEFREQNMQFRPRAGNAVTTVTTVTAKPLAPKPPRDEIHIMGTLRPGFLKRYYRYFREVETRLQLVSGGRFKIQPDDGVNRQSVRRAQIARRESKKIVEDQMKPTKVIRPRAPTPAAPPKDHSMILQMIDQRLAEVKQRQAQMSVLEKEQRMRASARPRTKEPMKVTKIHEVTKIPLQLPPCERRGTVTPRTREDNVVNKSTSGPGCTLYQIQIRPCEIWVGISANLRLDADARQRYEGILSRCKILKRKDKSFNRQCGLKKLIGAKDVYELSDNTNQRLWGTLVQNQLVLDHISTHNNLNRDVRDYLEQSRKNLALCDLVK